MRILALVTTLFFSDASLAQTLSTDYVEKFISSSCAVMMPLLFTNLVSESSNAQYPGPYAQGANLVEYLRTHANEYYEQLTEIAVEFEFESLEEWAGIADRVTIVRLSLTSAPGAYTVRQLPDDAVIMPEWQRAAVEIYLKIAALMTTVTDAEKAVVRPFLDDMDDIDCFKRNPSAE